MVELENGVKARAFSPSQYVKAAVQSVEDYINKSDGRWKLPKKAETPMTTTCRPELDVSPVLGPAESAYFQSMIGVLR